MTLSSKLFTINHMTPLEVDDLVRSVSQVLFEYVGIVLAQKGGMQIERLGKIREAQRKPGKFHLAKYAIAYFANRAALA